MASNTKLLADQKTQLRYLRSVQKSVKIGKSFGGYVTVALQRTGHRTGVFSSAIASHDEKKIRPKVGEFYARLRLSWGLRIPITLLPEEDLQDVANSLADVLSNSGE